MAWAIEGDHEVKLGFKAWLSSEKIEGATFQRISIELKVVSSILVHLLHVLGSSLFIEIAP